jgi:hypothetical protein
MIENFIYPTATDDGDRVLLANVKKYGWHACCVFGDETGPEFTYSIGFYLSYGHPEVLIIGLPSRAAHALLGALAERISKGQTYSDGSVATDIAPCKILFRRFNQFHYIKYMGIATWFYASLFPRELFPTIQLVFPDKSGYYPWDDDYDTNLIQTILD